MDKYKKEVYELIKNIPVGKVATYGQISKRLKIPSPRIVGRILHQNKDPKNIPCHRVVFSDGNLSFSYAFGGLQSQKDKLKKEGVIFKGDVVILKDCLFDFKNNTKNFS